MRRALLFLTFSFYSLFTYSQEVGLNIGDIAPELSYNNPKGNKMSLSSLRGKVVLIEFWASWCGPCKKERPNIVNTFRQYVKSEFTNGDGFQIYSVSLDTKRKNWVDAINKNQLFWEYHVSDLGGWQSAGSNKYGIRSIPSNVLIDGNGIIIAKDLKGGALGSYLASILGNYSGPSATIENPKKTITDSWSGNGSGFFISKSGYIATNYHVIDGASEIEVEFKYKNEIKGFNAKVIKVDKTNDLAIIKIDDSNFSKLSEIPYNFRTRSIDIGSEVFALGYPMALSLMGKDIKFTDGKISSKTGIDGNITTYQISAPILPGNSGGPLFDTKGNLIGVNSSGLARGGYESVGYSIKTNYLLNLIDVLPETIALPSSTQLASKPLTEQIKALSDYVVLIKVK